MQASDIIQPTVLSTPVAVDGLKNTIPTDPPSSSSNLASITEGFPSITMQSVANGGLPPMGQDFNGLFYLATDQKVYLQNGGIITFNADVSTAIGGYPSGAILDYVDGNGNFAKVQSLIDNNTYNFVTTPSYIDGEHWQELNSGGTGSGMPVGTIFAHTCSADFVPENSLPCDGTEYTQAQFPTLYTNWLVSGNLNTCTYEEYQAEISTNGECLKWALDTINQKFKVPTINNIMVRSSVNTIPVKGNGMTLGLTDMSSNFGLAVHNSSAFSGVGPSVNSYGVKIGTKISNYYNNDDASLGVTAIASKSGLIADTSDVLITQEIRYFVVVATGTINQSEMDWSEWASEISIINARPYITETYVNGTSGYIVYSNGLCEQWGYQTNISFTEWTVISLLKEYKDSNYCITAINAGSVQNIYPARVGSPSVNTSNSFSVIVQSTTAVFWRTFGYIS